jgi:hypothetical protein
MRYALLIYLDEDRFGQLPPDEVVRLESDCMAFGAQMRDAGVHIAAQRLRPTPTATTVRVRNGQSLTTDGPFAETKEQLAGFYLIEADNLDEAVAWAGRLPQAEYASIEVRPASDQSCVPENDRPLEAAMRR